MGDFGKKQLLVKVKNSKPFFICDLLVYTITAIIIAVLLVFFVFIPQKIKNLGFYVAINGDTVVKYFSSSNLIEIDDDYIAFVEVVEDGDKIRIKINQIQTDGYNIVEIDTVNKTAKITDSNCPNKDCTSINFIKNSGAIPCPPHKLKVAPIGEGQFNPPISG